MFKNFIAGILEHSHVGVFSHLRPDGDCLGAQVGFCLWLQKNGVEVTAFNEDSAPDNLTWLTDLFPVSKPDEETLTKMDAFVVLDGNALHRFGPHAESLSDTEKPIYMIDHHPQPHDIFEVAVSRPDFSSTCELVYNLYDEHDLDQLDRDASMALFTGIVTDTGSFQFDSVTPDTMSAAAELMHRGDFSPDQIAGRLYNTRSLEQLSLLSMALGSIRMHAGGAFASITVTDEMFTSTGTTREDTEGFVQYPLSVAGVKACVLFREDEDRIKLSLRSRSNVDVNQWAREFNGGGHAKAAGAWHKGPLDKVIEEVMQAGQQQLT